MLVIAKGIFDANKSLEEKKDEWGLLPHIDKLRDMSKCKRMKFLIIDFQEFKHSLKKLENSTNEIKKILKKKKI